MYQANYQIRGLCMKVGIEQAYLAELLHGH